MPIGGFNGSDPSPTLAQFQQYVADGRIHWFIGGGAGMAQRRRQRLGAGDRRLGGGELRGPDRRRRHPLRPERVRDGRVSQRQAPGHVS